MAIVYTYPKTTNIEETDLFILSKMNLDGRPTKSVAASDLAAFLAPLIPSGGVQGSGTTSTLPIWTNGPTGVLGDSVIKQSPVGAANTGLHVIQQDVIDTIPSSGVLSPRIFIHTATSTTAPKIYWNTAGDLPQAGAILHIKDIIVKTFRWNG